MDSKSFQNPKPKLDLQDLQAKQVLRLLGLNKPEDVIDHDQGEDSDCVWKILVWDKFCQDVLSTLFKVGCNKYI